MRVVVGGLALQVVLALFCIKTSVGVAFFEAIAQFVQRLIQMAQPGVAMVFGNLSEGNFAEGGWGFPFAFAASGLPVIIFFSALMAILYHLGVMRQLLVYLLAQVMTKLLGVSGAESMSMAANVFVGQTEAPLVVKPYIPGMTRSEAQRDDDDRRVRDDRRLGARGLPRTSLGEQYGPHLITASVMSAPAAFLIAKIMVPETEVPATGSNVELRVERTASNVVEAAANGTSDGVKLWLNVVAMLIAFMGLVAMADWFLGALRVGLTLNTILSYLFAPVAWLMGVEGWHDCQLMGSLLGTKVAVNEFIAFEGLLSINAATGEGAFDSERTAIMASYALCGFANFASVGIQIGGITPLAPERRSTIAGFAVRAMLGGAFASWMTATVAGMFL